MTFLQPWLLVALPLVALPVIIHLVNQRRFQSVDWAAMMFLASAKTLARGYSRLRQWLIMLLRMAAVAAAILAVSRPLSQGWLAAAGGGRSDGAIVILDRSKSMSQASAAGGASKLATARRQVVAALETLGTGGVVLIESVSRKPLELASPRSLERLPEAEPSAAAADLPLLLQAACKHIDGTKLAAGTIWICSDQRANDWKPADAAWPAIRGALSAMPQRVRLNLLGYPEPAADNRGVRVAEAVLEPRGKGWELLLDITVRREAGAGPARVPVQIELGGARSTVEIELAGLETTLFRHAIPLEAAAIAAGDVAATAMPTAGVNGWGRVSIPNDDNPADNDFYFVFATPTVRRAVVVAEDAATKRTLELVAGIPPDRLWKAAVETADASAIATLPLDEVAILLWQAPLPEGDAADAVARFVDRGGRVIFLPPESPTAATFGGMAWQAWEDHSPPLRPSSWRADDGLLAATLAGESLPVGDLEVRRVCGLSGDGTALAMLPDGRPLVVRAATDRGGITFLATTPSPRDSDLAANGVVLYAAVQRAIADGLGAVARARQADAGPDALDAGGPRAAWRQIAGTSAVSTEAGFHAGVYVADGRMVAVNRPVAEDAAEIVSDRQVDAVFAGLPFHRFRQQAGGMGSIVEEVWRLFLIALVLALAAEGLLCLPRPSPRTLPGGFPGGLPGAAAGPIGGAAG